MLLDILILFFLLAQWVSSIPYSEYILAPSSRTVLPVSVYNVNGTVQNAQGLLSESNNLTILSASSAVTLDFGKNIAGQVSLTAGSSSSSTDVIWLTYTESSLWIGNVSDVTGEAKGDVPM